MTGPSGPTRLAVMSPHRTRRSLSLITAAGLAALLLTGGCTFQDAMCSDGEYPVKAVDSTTGGACVKDGEEPPAGYVRYPAGKVPKHVDDEWDKYWNEHRLNKDGQEIAGP
jgi:hypothetical protein